MDLSVVCAIEGGQMRVTVMMRSMLNGRCGGGLFNVETVFLLLITSASVKPCTFDSHSSKFGPSL